MQIHSWSSEGLVCIRIRTCGKSLSCRETPQVRNPRIPSGIRYHGEHDSLFEEPPHVKQPKPLQSVYEYTLCMVWQHFLNQLHLYNTASPLVKSLTTSCSCIKKKQQHQPTTICSFGPPRSTNFRESCFFFSSAASFAASFSAAQEPFLSAVSSALRVSSAARATDSAFRETQWRRGSFCHARSTKRISRSLPKRGLLREGTWFVLVYVLDICDNQCTCRRRHTKSPSLSLRLIVSQCLETLCAWLSTDPTFVAFKKGLNFFLPNFNAVFFHKLSDSTHQIFGRSGFPRRSHLSCASKCFLTCSLCFCLALLSCREQSWSQQPTGFLRKQLENLLVSNAIPKSNVEN